MISFAFLPYSSYCQTISMVNSVSRIFVNLHQIAFPRSFIYHIFSHLKKTQNQDSNLQVFLRIDCVYVYIYMHTLTPLYLHACICMCIYMCVFIDTHIDISTYIHIHIHMNILHLLGNQPFRCILSNLSTFYPKIFIAPNKNIIYKGWEGIA